MRGISHEPSGWARLAAVSARQFGVFGSLQASECGISEDALYRASRAGRLVRVRSGIYRDPSAPPSWKQELMWAQLWAGKLAVLSHRSAAALHGLWGFDPGPVELTAPIARRAPKGVVVHRGQLVGADVVTRGPLRVSSPTRTLVEIAAVSGEEVAEIALDCALHKGLTSIPYLMARLRADGTNGRKGASRLLRLAELRVPIPTGLESPLETKFLRLLRSARLPQPEAGVPVGPYRLDFAYPHAKLGIELEGHEYHSGKKALARDVARRNYFLELGWSILYFTWDDVTKDSSGVVRRVRGHLFPWLVS